MNEPLGLIGPNDPRYREYLPGHQEASPTGATGAGATSGDPHRPVPRPFIGFDLERATYERLKPELLASAEGRFVVVVGNDHAGPVETRDDAERIGYEVFGMGPLYIKQLLANEITEEISREIAS